MFNRCKTALCIDLESGIDRRSTRFEEVVPEVTNIEPNPPYFLPVPLHIMHDNPPSGGQYQASYQASFDLAPDQIRCVDVVAISDMHLGPDVLLKHAVNAGSLRMWLVPGVDLQ